MADEGEEEYQQSLFSGPRRPKKQFLAMSNIYFHFFIIFFRTLNSFTLTLGTDQNRFNSVSRLSLAANYIYMIGDELGTKFSYASI